MNDVGPNDLESLMAIDVKAEIDRILSFIRDVTERLRRTGAVVGLSGGIDSAVTASLCVEALGRDRVVGVVLPERDSSPESERLASEHAERLGIEVVKRDITPILESIGTYRMRDAVVKKIMGDVPEGSVMSLVQPKGLLETGSLGIYRIKLTTPGGEVREKRLNREGLRGIISSTNTIPGVWWFLMASSIQRPLLALSPNNTVFLLSHTRYHCNPILHFSPITKRPSGHHKFLTIS